MADLISMLAAAAGAAAGGGEVDPNFNQTVLLLHGDGTDGAQNNTFLDSSTNNFTITRNGNTTQGTFSPFSAPDGRWSNYFDGTGDTFTTAATTAFDFGNNNFTIEAWIYTTSFATAQGIISSQNNGDPTTIAGWVLGIGSTGSLSFHDYAPAEPDGRKLSVSTGGTQVIFLNQWHHVVIEKRGTGTGQIELFVDGVSVASSTSNANVPFATSNNPLTIANWRYSGDTDREFTGYISNLRVVNAAVYNGSVTVPNAPFSRSTTSQSLLTCYFNRFGDANTATSAKTLTVNGTPKVTPFSPFAPTAAYSASVNGGSGYFDRNGDFLRVPAGSEFAYGTGDFTAEGWFYHTAEPVPYGDVLFAQTAGGVNYFLIVAGSNAISSTKNLTFHFSGTVVTSTNTYLLNAWNHFAVVRQSGTVYLYINGVANGSAACTFDFTDTTYQPTIGGYSHSSVQPFAGYISSVRIVKGTAVYTAAFTPPTAPLTAISGTELLTNFTNAGIFDNTGKNNLETVGNAQIDTTTKKYGTGSMEFDGTGDWLKVPNSPDIQLGTGDFTIEFWVYLASGDTGSNRGLVGKGGASTGWLVSLNTTEKVVFTYTTSTITSSGAITTNAWNHIAVVREGTGSNETKIYIGGTNDGTGTVSTDFNQTEVMHIGANRAAGDPMKGFIDDLRITKGVARYTAAFTPPTKEFPNL